MTSGEAGPGPRRNAPAGAFVGARHFGRGAGMPDRPIRPESPGAKCPVRNSPGTAPASDALAFGASIGRPGEKLSAEEPDGIHFTAPTAATKVVAALGTVAVVE